MNKSAANTPRTRTKKAEKPEKTRDDSPKENKNSPNPKHVRYAFVPILSEFRRHTKKNEARLWIPVETSLLVRYEFASCSLHTRYIFVAILLYCGANGLEEIPLDARFMSSVLVADCRTVEKSFEELLSKNLLQEREKREKREKRKEQTDKQETFENGAVCVEDLNLSQTESEEIKTGNEEIKTGNEEIKTGNESGLLKKDSAAEVSAKKHLSRFSIDECLRYVELCINDGEKVESPKALATHLFKTGEADSFILAKLYPTEAAKLDAQKFGAPVKFSDEPCSVCLGAKLADADGKGYRACRHCVNERGKATGLEPEKENK